LENIWLSLEDCRTRSGERGVAGRRAAAMPLDGQTAGVGQTHPGMRAFGQDLFIHPEQAGPFQFGEMAGEIARCQPNQALEEQEIGALAGREGSQNGEAAGSWMRRSMSARSSRIPGMAVCSFGWK